MNKHQNLIFFGVDSLCREHMSLHGYNRLTTPHIDHYFRNGIVFENCISPSIPTTPAYASMLTGMDCFSTGIVALRHVGDIACGIKTLPEILREHGYTTTCVGHEYLRGFDKHLQFAGWGSWEEGRSPKAEKLNEVALPELERLAAQQQPFMLMLRHMDPHSPYLPPEPFHRMFYQGDEFDPNNKSLEPVYAFKPFCDYLRSWFPPGCTDEAYITAQYDASIAYMDTCIQSIFQKLKTLGLEDNTVVVLTADHGETMYEHDCFFDHHGLYDSNLFVPFAIKYTGTTGCRIAQPCYLKDVAPTVLGLLGIEPGINFDGRNLMQLVEGKNIPEEPCCYMTEATWMRKHGWRTPEWKLIIALEPDFHYKPETELYNLINDPDETTNLADQMPDIVEKLRADMFAYIDKRERATGRVAPIYTNTDWSGHGRTFTSSDDAYNTLHIGDRSVAARLKERQFERIPFRAQSRSEK